MRKPTIIANLSKNSRETVRIALDEYRGVNLVDIRIMVIANDPSGAEVPTKKGISLRVEQLPHLLAALHAAEAEVRRSGLISRDKAP